MSAYSNADMSCLILKQSKEEIQGTRVGSLILEKA